MLRRAHACKTEHTYVCMEIVNIYHMMLSSIETSILLIFNFKISTMWSLELLLTTRIWSVISLSHAQHGPLWQWLPKPKQSPYFFLKCVQRTYLVPFICPRIQNRKWQFYLFPTISVLLQFCFILSYIFSVMFLLDSKIFWATKLLIGSWTILCLCMQEQSMVDGVVYL